MFKILNTCLQGYSHAPTNNARVLDESRVKSRVKTSDIQTKSQSTNCYRDVTRQQDLESSFPLSMSGGKNQKSDVSDALTKTHHASRSQPCCEQDPEHVILGPSTDDGGLS